MLKCDERKNLGVILLLKRLKRYILNMTMSILYDAQRKTTAVAKLLNTGFD